MSKGDGKERKDEPESINISEVEQYIIDRVKELRTEKKLTQRDLAYRMDVSQVFIAHVENPRAREKYNINHVYKLVEILECDITDILPPVPKKKK